MILVDIQDFDALKISKNDISGLVMTKKCSCQYTEQLKGRVRKKLLTLWFWQFLFTVFFGTVSN